MICIQEYQSCKQIPPHNLWDAACQIGKEVQHMLRIHAFLPVHLDQSMNNSPSASVILNLRVNSWTFAEKIPKKNLEFCLDVGEGIVRILKKNCGV